MLTGPAAPFYLPACAHSCTLEETEFREGADDLRLYPVISVGFGLRF